MEIIESLAKACRIPNNNDQVLNSECAYSFHSPFTSSEGILVPLMPPFIGFHPGVLQVHDLGDLQLDLEQLLFVRIVKRKVVKEVEEKVDGAEKVTKLGIGVDGGFQDEEDKYCEVSTCSIVALVKAEDGKVAVNAEIPFNDDTKASFPMQVVNSATGVIDHSGIVLQQDVKEWEMEEDPKPVSKYCESLEFVDNGVQISPDPSTWKCGKSGDTENLWLNLSDGFIGGGRKNWDGSGGSNGALDHYHETGDRYPLVVKLGTITADIDTADCFSYAKDEDGPVKIPNLVSLLNKRGINVAAMKKIAKSVAEMEVELNATFAFDAITEESHKLVPVSGPGLQGLQNMGNSCYINSVVQTLFSGTIPELSSRFSAADSQNIFSQSHLKLSPKNAMSDFLCQTSKLATALKSGAFVEKRDGKDLRLAPKLFKHVVGCNHVDFKTGQQQDAAQYLQFFLDSLDRAEMGAGTRLYNKENANEAVPMSSSLFAFKALERIVCTGDSRIKYRECAPENILTLRVPMEILDKTDTAMPDVKRQKAEEDTSSSDEIPAISFEACISAWAKETKVDDYRWPHLQNAVHPGVITSHFVNFPRYLFVQIQRYTIGDDWTPKKLEVKIEMQDEIDISSLRSSGPTDGESLVPNEIEESSKNETTNDPSQSIDEGVLSQLMDMGFSMNGCTRALLAVGGSNAEAAMNWIFEHSQDPDFNDPVASSSSNDSSSNDGVDEAVVMSLVESLGCFTSDQVRSVLKITDGAPDRAADWLFSHMDDLEASIAAAQGTSSGGNIAENSLKASQKLEDGGGQYTLIGMISHIGKNTGSGHYVCHLKKDGKWIIFNDEKVALSETPPKEHAYLYLFQRNDSILSPNKKF